MSTVTVTNTMNVSDLIHEAVIKAWINGWNTSETVVYLKDQFTRYNILWPSSAEYRTSPRNARARSIDGLNSTRIIISSNLLKSLVRIQLRPRILEEHS